MVDNNTHITVLLSEAVDILALKKDSIVVDATLGSAGHSMRIATQLGAKGILISLDADSVAVEQARAAFAAGSYAPKVNLVISNFRDIATVLDTLGIEKVDAILADLGWRQEQFGGTVEKGGSKGFSFRTDEPLLMTFGDPATYPFTAFDIINEWAEESITDILEGYGEERYARRIAKRIVEARQGGVIATTSQLVNIIEHAVPAVYRYGKIHPATRTFQALRITVNDELGVLRSFIESAVALLKPNGRLAIITFHSLEDRIVKHRFRELAAEGVGTVVTKRPMVVSEQELVKNPRARSAKLRAFMKSE